MGLCVEMGVKKSIHKRLINHYREYGLKSIFKSTFVLIMKKTFRFWEKLGFYIVPAHFYEPIPNSKDLITNEAKIWKASELIGVNMNDKMQLDLCTAFQKYQNEFTSLNERYRGRFENVDREILYCMVRHFKPSKIIEIGSGGSTYISIAAISANRIEGKDSELIVVDPYPRKSLRNTLKKHNFSIVQDKCENLNMDFFLQLKSNDILFIDSTHVIKTGGEVNYLMLEVLPRLNKEVIIHFHDIFLPLEYPKKWIVEKHLFWTEQYLLHAFLIHNNCFEVLWGGHYMHVKYPEKLRSLFPYYNLEKELPKSFWIRKTT
jgi:hypothetical protein